MIEMPFQKLKIWEKAMKIVDQAYEITKQFPSHEQYSLTSQIRRCAVSIPSNIAEGSQRGSAKDFANFLLIAKGSLAELHTQLLIAFRQGYISQEMADSCVESIIELDKMIRAFHHKICPIKIV